MLHDRVELRFNAVFSLVIVDLPESWNHQITNVSQNGIDHTVATFFYEGRSSTLSLETYDFRSRWTLEFRPVDLDAEPEPGDRHSQKISVSTTSTVFLAGFGWIPYVSNQTLGAATSLGQTTTNYCVSMESRNAESVTLQFDHLFAGLYRCHA